MHDHDLDLIAALAEGELDAAAADVATADIAACDRCSADLAAQRLALETISTEPTPSLTPAEAVLLRDSVAEALSIGPAVVSEPKRTRRAPWGAIAVAAASLAGIVAIVPVLGLLSTADNGDASNVTDVVALVPAEEESPAGEELRVGTADGTAQTEEEAAASDAAGQEAPVAAEAAETTTTAPAADAAATTAAPATTTIAAAGLPSVVTPPDLELALAEGVTDDDLLADGPDRVAAQCADAAAGMLGPDAAPLTRTVILDDGRQAVAFVDTTRTLMVVFSITDCAVVLTLP